MKYFLVYLLVSFYSLNAWSITVRDDIGHDVALEKPAKRIVSLAPHITENLFAAGAGDQVVGVVEYSDYPERAKNITSIGSYRSFNLEAILALNPDLVVAWRSGNGDAKIAQLKSLGLNVFVEEPRKIEDIAGSIRRFGALAGHGAEAERTSQEFLRELNRLRKMYSNDAPVGVFYQVWNDPLQTLNGNHLISDVIRLCSGRNVFSEAKTLAPHVSVEGVIAADPDVIVASGMGENRPEWLDDWRPWDAISAVRNGHLYFINPDHLERHSARILLGAEKMCQHLQRAR